MRIPSLLSSRIANFLAIVALAAATLAVCGDVLFLSEGHALSSLQGDLTGQFLAWRNFAFTELAHGHLPLWNPYFFSGAPFLGGFQSALLYPPNWLYIFVRPLELAVNVDIALHIFLGGVFTFFWARRRGMHVVAGFVGALVFMFGGAHFLHVYAGHLSNLCTMAWAPLIFLAIDLVCDAQSSRDTWRGAWIGAAAAAMQILAGHPQYVYYTALIAAIYAIFNVYRAPYRAGAVAGLLLIVLAAAALTAAQLLTGLGATAECVRNALVYDKAKLFPFPPENLLTLIVPEAFGGLDRPAFYWGRWTLWEDSLFIGVAALLLAIYGALKAPRNVRRFSLVMALIALVLALGYYTPLYVVLYRYLPGFASFRGVSKFIYLTLLFVAMLSAAGMDQLLGARPASRWPAGALLLGSIILTVLGLALRYCAEQAKPGAWSHFIDKMLAADWHFPLLAHPPARYAADVAIVAATSFFLAAGACFVLCAIWMLARRWRVMAYGIALVCAAELGYFAQAHHGSIDVADFRENAAMLGVMLNQKSPPFRIRGDSPGMAMFAGGYHISGDDPMILSRYVDFVDHVHDAKAKASNPLWRLFRLQYKLDGSANPPLVRLPFTALDRAVLVPRCVIASKPADIFKILDNESLDLTQVVVLEGHVEPGPLEITNTVSNFGKMNGDPSHVEVKDVSTDAMDVSVYAPWPAILLLTDNYAAGWQARSLDPNPPQDQYKVVPADFALRGIPLATGRHHLRIEYRPWQWVIGRWISLAALLVYLFWGIACFRPQRVAKEDDDDKDNGGDEIDSEGHVRYRID